MVGVFPPCRRPPERHALGRLGAASHAEMFLATVAWLAWALAHVATVRRGRTRAAGGIQQQRCVAHRGQPRAAHRPKQPRPTVPRLLGAIQPCPDVKWGIVQPPDAEDRTSGGVGGSRGAIPVTRPDLTVPDMSARSLHPCFPIEVTNPAGQKPANKSAPWRDSCWTSFSKD